MNRVNVLFLAILLGLLMIQGADKVHGDIYEDPVCYCEIENEVGELNLQNMKSSYYNSSVRRFYNLVTSAGASLGEMEEGAASDIAVVYERVEYSMSGNSIEEATGDEVLFKAFGSLSTLPEKCGAMEVHGLSADGEYELLGTFTDEMSLEDISAQMESCNENCYRGIKYVFRNCTGELAISEMYPMVAATLDPAAHSGEPDNVVFYAQVYVDEVQRAEASYSQVVNMRANYGTSNLDVSKSWAVEGDKRTETITNNTRLYDLGYGTKVNSIVTRLTMPYGITADSVVPLTTIASRTTDYVFADTGKNVNYGFIMNRTSYHLEKADDGRLVFVVVTRFDDRPVTTSCSKSSNLYFYNLKVKVDEEVYSMMNNGSTTGAYTLEGEWELEGGSVSASNTKSFRIPVVSDNVYQACDLSVRTEKNYEAEAVVQDGKDYTYKFSFGAGSERATGITFYCNIEKEDQGEERRWHGDFEGLDIRLLESLGVKPWLYYSANRNQTMDLSSSGWVKAEDWEGELKTVKSLAIDFADYVLLPGKPLIMEMNMRAPENGKKGWKAKNMYSVSYAGESLVDLNSNETTLHFRGVMPEKDDLFVIKKINLEDYCDNHGDITSVFKVTSMEDSSMVWYDSITFTKEDIDDGICEKSVTFYLPMGSYIVEEVETARFISEKGELEGNVSWLEEEGPPKALVELDVDQYEDVTFLGKKEKWNCFSHNDICINDLGVM